MNTLNYRVRTVDILHLVDGLWSSSAFIHRLDEDDPCHVLLHAGRGRRKEDAQQLAMVAAADWLLARECAERAEAAAKAEAQAEAATAAG